MKNAISPNTSKYVHIMYLHACMHTYIHIYIRTSVHKYIHAYIHTQDISKNYEFKKKEVRITIKSKEISVASHAVRPVGNTELYATA